MAHTTRIGPDGTIEVSHDGDDRGSAAGAAVLGVLPLDEPPGAASVSANLNNQGVATGARPIGGNDIPDIFQSQLPKNPTQTPVAPKTITTPQGYKYPEKSASITTADGGVFTVPNATLDAASRTTTVKDPVTGEWVTKVGGQNATPKQQQDIQDFKTGAAITRNQLEYENKPMPMTPLPHTGPVSAENPQLHAPSDPVLRDEFLHGMSDSMAGGKTRAQAHAEQVDRFTKAGINMGNRAPEALGGGTIHNVDGTEMTVDAYLNQKNKESASASANKAQADFLDLKQRYDNGDTTVTPEMVSAASNARTQHLNPQEAAAGGGSRGGWVTPDTRQYTTTAVDEARAGQSGSVSVADKARYDKIHASQPMKDFIREQDNYTTAVSDLGTRPVDKGDQASESEKHALANYDKRKLALDNQYVQSLDRAKSALGDDWKFHDDFGHGRIGVTSTAPQAGQVTTVTDVTKNPYYVPPIGSRGTDLGGKPGITADHPIIAKAMQNQYAPSKPIEGADKMTGREVWTKMQDAAANEKKAIGYATALGFQPGSPDHNRAMDHFYAAQVNGMDLTQLNLSPKAQAIAAGIQSAVAAGRIGGNAGLANLKQFLGANVSDKYTPQQIAQHKQDIAEGKITARTMKNIDSDTGKAERLSGDSLFHNVPNPDAPGKTKKEYSLTNADQMERAYDDYMKQTSISSLTETERTRRFYRTIAESGSQKAKDDWSIVDARLKAPAKQTPQQGANGEQVPPVAKADNGGYVTVRTPDEARRLPKGTKFVGPDGRRFIR